MTITKEGALASFYTMNKAPIKHLKVYFSPKQAGTGDPSPSNVREISGWDKINIINSSVMKKIIFKNFNNATVTNGTATLNNDGSLTIAGTGDAACNIYCDIEPIIINNTINALFSGSKEITLPTGRCSISLLDSNDSSIMSTIIEGSSFYGDAVAPVSLPENTSFTSNRIRITCTRSLLNITLAPFYTHTKNTIINDLSSIGNAIYGGYMDLVTGELVETWGSVDLGSISTWYIQTYENAKWFRATLPNEVWQNTWRPNVTSSLNNHPPHFLIDRFKIVSGASIYYGTSGDNVLGMDWLATIRIKCDSYNDDIDAFKAAINGVTLYYEYATPITHQLNPTQLSTLIGRNNIWSNADHVEVEYDLAESNDELYRRRNILLRSAPHIETVSGSLAHFETDLVAPLKECKVYFEPKQDLHGYDKPWPAGGGKNLFNINAIEQNPSDTAATNTTVRIFTPGTYVAGTSWSNWFQPNQITSYSIVDNVLSVGNNNVYGVGFAFELDPGTTYAISATSTSGGVNVAHYDANGDYIETSSANILNSSFVTPSNAAVTVLTFYSRTTGVTSTFENIQLEKSSAVTTYNPYENICPVEGWTGIDLNRTGKSIVQFAETRGPSSVYINGNASWYDGKFKIPDRAAKYTYSAYINNRNAENASCVKVWFRNAEDTEYKGIVEGTYVAAGEEGYSYLVIGNNQERYYAILGLSLRTGAIATKGMLEHGDTRSVYEAYNGSKSSISFPLVTNLLTKITLTSNSTLSNEGAVISESGMTVTDFVKVTEGEQYTLTFTSKEGPRTRRIYGYDSDKQPVQSLASTSWVTVDAKGTINAMIPSSIQYIRVCYKTADEDIFLEGPESSVVYGGYIDMISGELVAEWCKVNITSLTWAKWGNIGLMYNNHTGTPRKANTIMYSNNATVDGTGDPQKKEKGVIGYYLKDVRYPSYLFIQTGIDTSTVDGVNNARTYINETFADTYIVYQLENPVHYQLSPTQLKTLRGQNNIWSNANGDISIKYWTH